MPRVSSENASPSFIGSPFFSREGRQRGIPPSPGTPSFWGEAPLIKRGTLFRPSSVFVQTSNVARTQPTVPMTGCITFHADPMFQRTSERMGVRERVVTIRARQHGMFGPGQNVTQAITQGLRDTVQRILDQQRIPDGDRFYINLSSDRLRNASNAFGNGVKIKHGPWPS